MDSSYTTKDPLSDHFLISRILSGETACYEQIVRRYNAYLYKIGRSYGYNHSDTEDLMQDAYVAAYLHLKDFRNQASFKTWLAKIMLHLCFHKRQKFSFKKEVAMSNCSDERTAPLFTDQRAADTGKTVINDELNNVLETAIQQIPYGYRMVFTLRELNGLNVTETAEALNISEANVKTRLSRAKKLLQNELQAVYAREDLYEFNLIYCDGMVARVMAALGLKYSGS